MDECFRNPISFSSENFHRHEVHSTTERAGLGVWVRQVPKYSFRRYFIGSMTDKGASD